MMKYLTFIVLFFFASEVAAQLIDNFDDASFPSDPTWTGDTQNFMVNDDGQLQLNAPDAGSSAIFSATQFVPDTISFAFNFFLDFSPSGSNQLRIYLALDGEDPSTASGYFLELGETGSDDALRFYYLDSGTPFELAVGTIGAVAENPMVTVKVDAFPSGLWVINADYTGGTNLEEDVILTDNQFDIYGPRFFGLECTYTASRAELFYFDDINVAPFEQDREGPTVVDVEVQSENMILVTYSEPVTQASAMTLENYKIQGLVATAAEVVSPTVTEVTFDRPFAADQAFTITIENLVDVFDNAMEESQMFTLSFARPATDGDVIINEIMFAANVDGEDYVEIRNLTTDFLDLSGYTIGNNTKSTGATKLIAEDTKIAPQGYLAFTEERDVLLEVYEPLEPQNVVEQDIPDFNNDEGNVYIAKPDGTILDSYDYNEDAHFELLSEVKGISLERVSASLPTDDPAAWASASKDVNYGTPGYENSATLSMTEIEDMFEFVEKVFSPNADNDRDLMVLAYELDKGGYTANIDVRDVGGFLIKRIKRNETLSTSGLITWNGLDENGKIANIGMYVLVGELFHPDGDVVPLKKVCVLAGDY